MAAASRPEQVADGHPLRGYGLTTWLMHNPGHKGRQSFRHPHGPGEYESHYNGRRPRRSRQLGSPRPDYPVADLSQERIKRRTVLGDTHQRIRANRVKGEVRSIGRVLEAHTPEVNSNTSEMGIVAMTGAGSWRMR